MNKINELNNKRLELLSQVDVIEDNIQSEYNIIFDDSSTIKNWITELENGGEYSYNEYGEVDRFIRVDLTQFKDCLTQLGSYLSDNGIHLNSQHETIAMLDIAIIINREGDVYCQDSRKWVISKNDYESVSELKSLIENYMETSGYFPTVLREVDSYGTLELFNTKE